MNTKALHPSEPDLRIVEESAIILTPPHEAPRTSRRKPPSKSLADDVAGLEASLAKSLGVPAGADGYAPDLFVKSIKAIHDKLSEVRDALTTRQSELDKMEMVLRSREKAVAKREEQATAVLALANVTRQINEADRQPSRPSWLARLFGAG
jgi:hypothetical protein